MMQCFIRAYRNYKTNHLKFRGIKQINFEGEENSIRILTNSFS